MKRFVLAVIAVLVVTGCDSAKETAKEPSMSKKETAAGAPESAPSEAYRQGMQYLEDGQVNEAIQSFAQAIQENPMDPEAYMILGQLYLRMENYGEAVQALSAAARVAPDRGDVFYFLSLAHGFNGDMEMARQSAQMSVSIFSEQRDQENFARSVALLQSLNRAGTGADAVSTAE